MKAHEARFRAITTELAELRSYPPDRKVKGRDLEEYRQRDEYLEFEVRDKTTFSVHILRKPFDDPSAHKTNRSSRSPLAVKMPKDVCEY